MYVACDTRDRGPSHDGWRLACGLNLRPACPARHIFVHLLHIRCLSRDQDDTAARGK